MSGVAMPQQGYTVIAAIQNEYIHHCRRTMLVCFCSLGRAFHKRKVTLVPSIDKNRTFGSRLALLWSLIRRRQMTTASVLAIFATFFLYLFLHIEAVGARE